MMDSSLYLNRPLGPVGFLVYLVLVGAAAVGLCFGAYYGLKPNHHFYSLSIYLCILIGIFATGILVMYALRRLQDQAVAGIWVLLLVFPLANIPLFLFLEPKVIFSSGFVLIPVLGLLSLARFLLPGKRRE